MKKISRSVYENLTPKQRVVACIEALSRDDESERQRLVQSCPKLTFMQVDPRFSDTMDQLMNLAMAVELNLSECVLRFLIGIRADPEIAQEFLQDFADIREAWRMTVNAMGINEAAMAAAGPPSSPTFEPIEGLLPGPNAGRAKSTSAEMLDALTQN